MNSCEHWRTWVWIPMHLNCRSALMQRRTTLCNVAPTYMLNHPPHRIQPLTCPHCVQTSERWCNSRASVCRGSREHCGIGWKQWTMGTSASGSGPLMHSTTGGEGKYRGPRKEAQLIGDLHRKSEPDGQRGNKHSFGREARNKEESLRTTDHSQIKGPKLRWRQLKKK